MIKPAPNSAPFLVDLYQTIEMLELWTPDTFPADDQGKVHFGRALIESAIPVLHAAGDHIAALHALVLRYATVAGELSKSIDRTDDPVWDVLRDCATEMHTLLDAAAEPPQREPDGYAYRYSHPFGGTTLRFNDGRRVNGSPPLEAVPYWLGKPPS